MIYATELACTGARLAPRLETIAERNCACAWCGRPIAVGERCANFATPHSFTDGPRLAVPGGDYLCGWCRAVQAVGKPFTQALGRCVITADGLFPFASNNDRAHFILNPPAAPYVAVNITAQQQHIVWKAPVTLGSQLMRVQFGDRLLQIRRARVLAAAAAVLDYLEDPAHQRAVGRRREPPPFPIRLDRDLESFDLGAVRPGVPEPLAEQLRALSYADLFALSPLVAMRRVAPTPPKPYPLSFGGEPTQ